MDNRITSFYGRILDALEIRHTMSQVQVYAQKQPKLITFSSIKDFIERYNVKTKGIELQHKERVNELSFPFIARLNHKWVMVLGNTGSNQLIILRLDNANCEKEIISKDQFISLWNGTALLIDYTDYVKERSFLSNVKKGKIRLTKLYLLICSIICFIGLMILANPLKMSWELYCLLSINGFGIYVCFLLLQKQLHISNKIADRLCGLIKQSHCEDVTSSDGGTILGFVKLSELGFSFFVINFCCILIYPEVIDSLAIIAWGVLPFSFWSLWYQKFKVKSWCVMCLLTLLFMWAQGAIYIFAEYPVDLDTNLYGIITVGCLYIILTITTNFIMSMFDFNNLLKYNNEDYQQLKSDCRIVRPIMGNRPKYDITEEKCSVLIFGNKNAGTTITVFSNPYCSPCADMHKQLEDYPGNNVRIQYILTYFSEELSMANQYIIAAYNQLGADRTWQLLSEWYAGGKKNKHFFDKLNLQIDEVVVSEFEKQKSWVEKTSFVGTPTVLVNGIEVVWPYEVDDYPELSGCLESYAN